MTGSSTSSSPLAPRLRPGVARGLSGLRQAIDLLRHPADQRGSGARADRSDVRAAVLTLLAEQPMNGYQIVRAIEERGLGAQIVGVRTGAGSVYPTLQLLADEGLATAAETGGRKTYTLTASGRAAAGAARDRGPAPLSGMRTPERRGAIPRAGAQLAQAVALVAQGGTAEQVADSVAVLDEARRRIHSILARN